MLRTFRIYQCPYKLFYLLLFIFITNSCSQSNNLSNIYSEYNTLKKIVPSDSIVLLLDHEATPSLISMEIQVEGDEAFLYNGVLRQNIIKKFNLESSKLISTIDLRMEGPNRLNELFGCQHISVDTLLCHDDLSYFSLIHYEPRSNFKKKLISYKFDQDGRLYFDPTLIPPVKLNHNRFIIPNYYTDNYNQPLMSIIDFKEKKVSYHLNVPDEYIEGYFGWERFGYWNYVYHSDTKKFYFSFPNLDSLYVYDSEFVLQDKRELKSTFKESPNEPIFLDKDLGKSNKKKMVDHLDIMRGKRQFIYESLLYNQEKKQYYRFMGLPIPQYRIDLEDPIDSEIRYYSLIVANSELEYQAEYAIPFNQYDLELKAYFVHDGKLYIQRKIDSEDEIIVDIFDI